MIGKERRNGIGRKIYTAEQIIGKLREVEVLLSQGDTIGVVSRYCHNRQKKYQGVIHIFKRKPVTK